ncbi:hypothetical protein EHS25_008164 [Saitozyma podzolica]|uniref:Uncharacterized protein n=1 Tax=Saitozyma podzolica TaxID=1890683 RepID=A0A427YNK8_9TREE|nr:hypothetical protein EHS25_008164 [Saitozyma podzolica]
MFNSLTTLSGPSRPRAASRTISNLSVKSGYAAGSGSSYAGAGAYGMESRRWASDHGKKELYSDEGGSTGAGTDDVAHTDAAFDKNPDPSSSAKKVESESGKDFTRKSPANAPYSHPTNEPGETNGDAPLRTSKRDKKQHTAEDDKP